MDSYSEDTGYQSFVKVAQAEGSDEMELPREKDGTVLLSTVLAQFPDAIGLKYKSSSGGWRGIRAADNVLDPPFGGWGDTIYYITEVDSLKRKATSDVSEEASAVKSSKVSKVNELLQDMVVLGLPFTTTDDELKEYFTKTCGELAYHEVKHDRVTKKPRGFGFIRFKTEEAAKEALSGEHEIMGRRLEIRSSKKKETPMKLFVGRIPSGVDQEALTAYFAEFGALSDVYIPSPFRGFGFVTFASKEEGRTALRADHVIKGSRLNVTAAEPKDERPRRDQQQSYNSGPSNYTWKSGGNDRNDTRRSGGNDRNDSWRSSRDNNDRNSAPRQSRNDQGSSGGNDMAAELKNMLFAFLTK